MRKSRCKKIVRNRIQRNLRNSNRRISHRKNGIKNSKI